MLHCQFTCAVLMMAVVSSARMYPAWFTSSDMAMLMSVPLGEVVVVQTVARSC